MHFAAPQPIRIAAIQSRPVWLDPAGTTTRIFDLLDRAARGGAELAALSETFLCGYPFWVCRSNGAAFDDPDQKRAYACYLETAVELDGPELRAICEAAGDLGTFVFLGVTERGTRDHRGSTFCTLVAIHPERGLVGAHRKLIPTHDERLVWAAATVTVYARTSSRVARRWPQLLGELDAAGAPCALQRRLTFTSRPGLGGRD